jgi:hypothetical protein
VGRKKRTHRAERSAESLDPLAAFVKQMDGKPYEKNLMEMVRGTMSLNSGEDLSGVFCSELVAAAYQRYAACGS